jgi:hypothetical protein
MDEDFYDERHLSNVHHEMEFPDDPAEYKTTILYMGDHHRLRVHVGKTAEIPTTIGNICYDMRRTPGGVTYSNYDPAIVEINGDMATGKKAGYTYVRAERDGCFCEFLITVLEENDPRPLGWVEWMPYPEKEVVSFVPMTPAYTASVSRRELKQIRGMATYADGSCFEICGSDGVTYENHTPELFEIRPDGNVVLTGKTGTGRITATAGNCSFAVSFTVIP